MNDWSIGHIGKSANFRMVPSPADEQIPIYHLFLEGTDISREQLFGDKSCEICVCISAAQAKNAQTLSPARRSLAISPNHCKLLRKWEIDGRGQHRIMDVQFS